MRIVTVLAAFALLTSSALAFEDPATGFSIAPPAPFTVEPNARRQFDVGVGINSATGTPEIRGTGKYVCEAGFKAAPQNANLSRAEINALVEKPEWLNLTKATFELVSHIDRQQRFTLQGYRGFELHARPKAGPGAEDTRIFISLIETAKGRTLFMCGTGAAGFRAAVAQFRAIRATINLPK